MTNTEIMARAQEIAKWDEEMRNMNDENLVLEWLMYGVPDDAQPYEYPEWAQDEETYNDFKRLYEKLKALDEEEM